MTDTKFTPTFGNWEVHAACKCGWSALADFGNIWFVQQSHPVCPKCGVTAYNYQRKTRRWINTSRLFRPSTWGSGLWQDIDEVTETR